MTKTEIDRVAVLGSGTMGIGIAQVTASAGYKTVLYDVSEDAHFDRSRGSMAI